MLPGFHLTCAAVHSPFCRLHDMLVRISDFDGTVLAGIEFIRYLEYARQLATILNTRYLYLTPA